MIKNISPYLCTRERTRLWKCSCKDMVINTGQLHIVECTWVSHSFLLLEVSRSLSRPTLGDYVYLTASSLQSRVVLTLNWHISLQAGLTSYEILPLSLPNSHLKCRNILKQKKKKILFCIGYSWWAMLCQFQVNSKGTQPIGIHASILTQTPLPSRLPQNIEQSSLLVIHCK